MMAQDSGEMGKSENLKLEEWGQGEKGKCNK